MEDGSKNSIGNMNDDSEDKLEDDDTAAADDGREGIDLMMSLDIHKCEEEDDLDSQDDDGEGDEDTGDDEDPDLATQQRTISDTDFAMLLS